MEIIIGKLPVYSVTMSVKIFAVSSLLATLTACGGGSGSSSTPSTPNNQTPSKPEVNQNVIQNPDAFSKSNDPKQMTDSAASLLVLNELSLRRQSCGFGAVASESKLTDAANSHAAYIAYILNKSSQLTSFNPHEEVSIQGFTNITASNNPFYRGQTVADRIEASGYSPYRSMSTENIALKYISNSTGIKTTNADAAVSMLHGLLSAPYHQRTLLDARIDKASASVMSFAPFGQDYKNYRRYVLEMVGAASKSVSKPSKILTYPCQGTTNTQTALYHESPDPYKGSTRNLAQDPVGQPVYVSYPSAKSIKVSNVRFFDTQRNMELEVDLIDKDNDPYAGSAYKMTATEAFIIPKTDSIGKQSCDLATLVLFDNKFTANNCGLYANTVYQVSFDVNVDGQIRNHSFSFTTGDTNYSVS